MYSLFLGRGRRRETSYPEAVWRTEDPSSRVLEDRGVCKYFILLLPIPPTNLPGCIEMDSHDGTSGLMQPLGYIEMDSHDGTSGHM